MALSQELRSGGYLYRPLKYGTVGWDVYALQAALFDMDYAIKVDGHFGVNTQDRVVQFQAVRALEADGIAGIATQMSAAKLLMPPITADFGLPRNLLKGQVEKESGFLLGNHSLQYPNGTYDIGVTQLNTGFYSNYEVGFDPQLGLRELAGRVRNNYSTYKKGGNVSNRRAWELAAGSWNRPAYTDWLAGMGGVKPSPSQLEWIEGYIDRVTSYVTSWPTS